MTNLNTTPILTFALAEASRELEEVRAIIAGMAPSPRLRHTSLYKEAIRRFKLLREEVDILRAALADDRIE